jgi:hypothetical protein
LLKKVFSVEGADQGKVAKAAAGVEIRAKRFGTCDAMKWRKHEFTQVVLPAASCTVQLGMSRFRAGTDQFQSLA